MQKIKKRFIKWLITNYLLIKQFITRKKPQIYQPTYNYRLDKGKYITFKNRRGKIKLRQHIREVSEEITKVSNNTYNENRDLIIKIYNEYGLLGMHDKILAEFDNFNNKLKKNQK